MVGGLLAGHDRRSVEVAVGDAWKDRGVGDAQAIDADDTAFRVDDAQRIGKAAHLARAAGMVGALGVQTDEIVEFVVALHLAARRNLAAAIGVEGRLSKNLASEANTVAEVAPVVRMRHVVETYLRLRPWVR